MKAKHLVTLCLLAGFLAGFGLWGLLRTPGDVSQAERRPLAQWPELTVSGFLSGQYAGKLEHAAADQFPLREQFRTLRSLVSYDVMGQRDVNGVYLSQGYAAKLDFPLNTASVKRAADRFRYIWRRAMSPVWSTPCRRTPSPTPPGALTTCTTPISPARTAGCICR